MDIASWLRELGLGQYEPAFRENDIDGEVLRNLTAEDLRDLGVASVGHRRRFLDAIKALPADTAPTIAVRTIPTGAERRQLTVMFCDLAGSTALSTRLDPEDLRELLASYHAAVAKVVAGFDGYVAKYMGDGVLVYFGYPQAHEDDAERAVRAGLALAERIGRLESGAGALASRIGIATGLVVVGDLVGTGEAKERGVVGENAEPCRPSAGEGASEWRNHRRSYPPAGWQSLRISRSRHHRSQGVGCAGGGLAGAAARYRWQPFRGVALGLPEPTDRPGR
jgi:class 3 adenylate cyclase